MHYIYVALLVAVTAVLWGLATTYNHHLEGVAVYSVAGSLPMKSVSSILSKTLDGNRANNVFIAENKLLPVCVFPDVYNAFDGKTTAEIKTILVARGMTEAEADAQVPRWTRINFQGWDNPYQLTEKPADVDVDYNVPYNLPYEGLAAGKHLNPQYFSPVCRCMNTVFNAYKAVPAGTATYDKTVDALKACLATQHHIKTLELRGNQDTTNEDLTQRKTISRHGLVFNLCIAIFFTIAYNESDFGTPGTNSQFLGHNMFAFIMLFLAFLVPFLSQLFAFHCVSPANSMEFSTIVHVPAAVILIIVEWMWSRVAKESDTRRQTYLHPYSFYQILVHLQLIALIENGVFTFHVLVTAVFTCNIVALAYAAVLFIAHGKLWKAENGKPRTGEITGYIMILVLVGLTYAFNMMPSYPLNSELNFLWLLPVIFAVFCFSQVVVLEHLLGEDVDEPTDASGRMKKLQFTNSVHLLNMGHTFVVAAVIVYYAAQMHYTWHGDMSMVNTGGLVDRRLNFELSELAEINPATLSYNPLQGGVLRST